MTVTAGRVDRRSSGPAPVPVWAVALTGALCLIGTGVSAYLTYVHFNSPNSLACPDTGIINCDKVVTSSYSVIFGVPVPVAGLVFFVAMAGLCSPWAWRSAGALIRRVRLTASVIGVGMIMWLIYVELFRLDALCLWCTSLHVITVLLFFTVAFGTAAATAITVTDRS